MNAADSSVLMPVGFSPLIITILLLATGLVLLWFALRGPR